MISNEMLLEHFETAIRRNTTWDNKIISGVSQEGLQMIQDVVYETGLALDSHREDILKRMSDSYTLERISKLEEKIEQLELTQKEIIAKLERALAALSNESRIKVPMVAGE